MAKLTTINKIILALTLQVFLAANIVEGNQDNKKISSGKITEKPATSKKKESKNTPVACYSRQYSAKHLKKHPAQLVSKIKFYHYRAYDDFYFHVTIKLKDDTRIYDAFGGCSISGDKSKHQYDCSTDCDGGRFSISLKDKRLILKNKEWWHFTHGEEDDEANHPAEFTLKYKDTYHLHGVNLSKCLK